MCFLIDHVVDDHNFWRIHAFGKVVFSITCKCNRTIQIENAQAFICIPLSLIFKNAFFHNLFVHSLPNTPNSKHPSNFFPTPAQPKPNAWSPALVLLWIGVENAKNPNGPYLGMCLNIAPLGFIMAMAMPNSLLLVLVNLLSMLCLIPLPGNGFGNWKSLED